MPSEGRERCVNLGIGARGGPFTVNVTDLLFVLITLAVFAALALCAIGAEKL